MKQSISILLCLILIFSSFSLCFATPVDWDSSDSANLANIRASVMSGGQLYNVVNACSSTLNNLNYNLVTLMGWLDPANGGGTSALLNQILNALVYTNVGGATVSFLNDLRTESMVQSSYLNGILTNLFSTNYTVWGTNISQDGTISTWTSQTGNWITAMFWHLQDLKSNFVQEYQMEYAYLANGYNAQQTSSNWLDLSNVNWTPTSVTNGLYTWLSNIQRPVARLSYVLASDERIEAQEAAAANEEAVIDNFIDSTGDGSVPTSSFSDVSGLSSGVTSNLSTDASPAQIWDIFNSDHGSWFSQETANQLDTTTRTRGSEFETPLLDQQMDEIYKSLGGGK